MAWLDAYATPTELAAWWTRFDDPVLSGLVTQALRANTTLASARAALRQARALRDVAAAASFPSLGSSASVQRSTNGLGDSSQSANRFQAGLDANWELDFFGVNRSAVNASQATAQASAASLGDVQVSLAAEVALAYITLRSSQARLAIAVQNLASQQETLQITQWREQAGLVTNLETEQARAAAEQTSAALPTLQVGIAQTGYALAVLTGQAPGELVLADAATSSLTFLEPLPADNLVLAIPAETLRQRPDVRAAEYQVSAAMARVAQAQAAHAPNFRLNGTVGLSALTLGALTNSAAVVSTLLGGVSFPVFDGGAASATVRGQEAAAEQAQASYQTAVLGALKEVENALVALRGDRLRLVRLRNAAAAAANANTLV